MSSPFRLLTCTIAMACATLTAGHALAHDSDQTQIAHVMMAAFDKPSDPLKVAPMVVQGDYAVADWIQSGRGGRAVMHKEQGHWTIMVCGGDGLKEAAALTLTGMPTESAAMLAKALATAEAGLDPTLLKQFAMFDGIVKVGSGHDVHHHTGTSAKP